MSPSMHAIWAGAPSQARLPPWSVLCAILPPYMLAVLLLAQVDVTPWAHATERVAHFDDRGEPGIHAGMRGVD